MTIGTLVRDRLTGYSGLSALVSTRVYPLILPQHPTYPAISYQRIDNGPQNGTSTIRESRWQINCWATTYAGVYALSTQVKAAFEEWVDADQSPSVNMAWVANEYDDYEDDVKTYRIIVDVMLNTTGG